MKHMESSDDLGIVVRSITRETLALTNNKQRPYQEGIIISSNYYSLNPPKAAPVARVESSIGGMQSGPRINTVIETGSLLVTAATGGSLEVLQAGKAVVSQNVTSGSSTTIRDLTTGSYTVRVSYAGNQKEEKQVSITSSGSTSASFTYQGQTAQSAVQPAATTQRPVQTPTGKYKIGDTGPGGGIIFFADGKKGMEVGALLGKFNWNTAKQKAAAYKGGNFSDWYLPTKEELNLVYQNLQKSGIAKLGTDWYWSSSEFKDILAWGQGFDGGRQASGAKYSGYSVRPVRAFNY
jgi:hypothetical protein